MYATIKALLTKTTIKTLVAQDGVQVTVETTRSRLFWRT
jgi:hypothetical protein